MATVKQFEDLFCWKKSRELVREVYKSLKGCNDYGFKDQIQRASVSVMSNIAEGFESGTKQMFLNYLFIAKASAGEVRAQLYVALDVGYLNIEKFKYLNGLATECSKLTSNFIIALKKSEHSGIQHKKEKIKKKIGVLDEYLKENDLVFTKKGLIKRKRAKELCLEVFKR